MLQGWQGLVLPTAADESSWELFHENSKMDRFTSLMDDQQAGAWMQQVSDSLAFDQYPAVALPVAAAPLDMPLGEVIARRATPARLTRRQLSLAELTTVLYGAYGINRSAGDTHARRPLRCVPSAGALYPLEIFFCTRSVDGLEPGLYHYHPVRHELRRLRAGDQTARLAPLLVQKQFAVDASVLLIIAALFERTVVKYGDRGYRFVLLEAGHVAQNVNLVACGLGLGSTNIGGYLDRQLDSLLGLDGLLQSAVYVIGIGGADGGPPHPPPLE